MQKRYTVYTFPALHGDPHYFRFKLTAWLFAITRGPESICELEDNLTGDYTAYWM